MTFDKSNAGDFEVIRIRGGVTAVAKGLISFLIWTEENDC
jgi:hypothetical protein